MNENNNIDKFDDEIDLQKLFLIVWDKKILIAAITSFAAIISVIYALSLPNLYISQSLLAPTGEEDSLSSNLGSYSGLASLTGIDLQSGGSSKSKEAITRIKSYDFFSKYFLLNIKLENLLALDEWVQQENTLIYNKELYDSNSNKWVRKVTHPQSIIPSDQEAFKKYKAILGLSIDKDTGFVSLSIEHKSPIIAKKWVNIIIKNINESMRELDKQKALNAINFLNESTNSTSVQSIKEVIAKLQESQMQTYMLASSNEEYIFKILDSPLVPEKKSGPNRASICIIGTLLGAIFSLFIVLIQLYRKSFKI